MAKAVPRAVPKAAAKAPPGILLFLETISPLKRGQWGIFLMRETKGLYLLYTYFVSPFLILVIILLHMVLFSYFLIF